MTRYINALVCRVPGFAVLLPAIMVPFLLGDSYTLPKAILLQLMLVLIVAAWVGKVITGGQLTVDRIVVHPAAIIFVFVLVLTTVLSGAPAISLFGKYLRHEGLFTWLAYISIFIAAVSHIEKGEIERWLKLVLLVALPISVYALAQFLGWDFMPYPAGEDLSRVFSTLGNSVYLGSYLVLVIPLALGLFFTAKSRARYLYGAVLILSSLALILTYTRAAWLGAAIAGVVFFAICARELNQKSWRLILGLSVVIVATVFVLLKATPEKSYIGPRLAASFNLSAGSVASRLGFWRTSAYLVRDRPLFGSGLETFGDVAWPYRPDARIRPGLADRPHNQLLYLASSVGLIGLAAYIWFLTIIFKQVWRGVRENEEPRDRVLLAAIFAAGLGYLVQEQFSFSQVETAPLFWFLMGLGVVLSRRVSSFKLYDFKRRPGPLAVGAVGIFIGLSFLVILNIRFLAADYRYSQYLDGRDGDSSLSSVVALNPYKNTYRNALGAYLFEQGRMSSDKALFARAAAEFEKALVINARDKVIAINLAKTYSILTETDSLYFDKAIGAYGRVLEIDPLYTAGHRSVAILLLQSGKSGPALVHLRKWLSVEADNGEALYYMGAVFDDEGNKAQAVEYYRRAAQVDTAFAKKAKVRLRSLTE
ncbi:MAG TPA: hypothetical protein ENI11_02560 [Actinobacteria bacterium]|nr:hypothetical protein [Actinomycetota bacterium]